MRASRAKVAGLQETATTVGTADAASARACASAPCRGGSNTTASNRLSSTGANGRRNRSRACASTGLSPCAPVAACCKRRDRRCIVVGRGNAGAFGEPQREWPDAAEQVGDCSCPGAVRLHQPRQGRFPGRRRLQEGARRQQELGAPDPQRRLGALRHHLAMAGEAREAAAVGDRRELAHPCGGQRAGSAHIDIEARIGRGDLNVERLALARQRLGNGPGGLDRALESWRQHRTAIDRHHAMRPERRESDLEHVMRAAPRMEHGAAASLAMRVDQIVDRRLEPALASASTTRPRFQAR